MPSRRDSEAEEYFRTLLLSLGNLRGLVGVSWRDLAGQVGVARTTVEAWLQRGTVPDEIDGVKKVATVLLTASRHATGPLTAEFVARLDHVDWSAAHRAVQAARGEGRSRSARAGRAQRGVLVQTPVPDREVATWTASQLNVHAAVAGETCGGGGEFVLPAYVQRAHDEQVRDWLRQLVEIGGAQLLVLRGGSCTGKTRSAFEAVREVMPGWRLVYPKTAQALVELLSGVPVAAGTVLWLDDLHRLLAESAGEQAAGLLRELLDQPGPVAAVATIWPDNYKALISTPLEGQADRHSQARSLLARGSMVIIPQTFTGEAWEEFVRRSSADASLSAVAASAGEDGGVTQLLAAGPELMEHWQHAPQVYGKAVISAAIDARRLGVRAPLLKVFLQHAATGYLTPDERADADPSSWFRDALDYACRPVKQVTSALRPVPHPTGMGPMPGVVDLADYLEQHAGALRWDYVPPATFWEAAHQHLDRSEDLDRLAMQAFSRGRFRISRALCLRAHELGSADAVEGLCFTYTETGRILTIEGREELVTLARDVDDRGYSLWYLGSTLASIGSDERSREICTLAEGLLADSFSAGHRDAAFSLAELWESSGLYEDAARLVAYARREVERPAAEMAAAPALAVEIKSVLAGAISGPGQESSVLRKTSRREVFALAHRLRDEPSLLPLGWQARLPELGYAEVTEMLLRALLDIGATSAPFDLERFLESEGRDSEAAVVLLAAAHNGNDRAVIELVSRWSTKKPDKAQELIEHCRRTGRAPAAVAALRPLLTRPQPVVRRLAEECLSRLAQDGSAAAQMAKALGLLEQWDQTGNRAAAEVPPDVLDLLHSASAHRSEARRLLGQHASITGDEVKAEHFFRGAIDGGDYTVVHDLAQLLHPHSPTEETGLARCGLEADGTPSARW
ncbi:hypothetical protein C5F59_039195 [Streptomyces sp. QL37]|uniref:hypothetical protein n=1 Tax=Streptomyces sp. QL37 TaxID=2093747 RepID=UPI000CF29A9D|nr:hypothetical protein [Streptomyces sp. QL37]PPQ62034.1 hypothetical protein C5F59_39370 [Streptomyces sp. QL37]